MVTSWPKYWDKVGNKSDFTYSMLRGSIMNPDRIADHPLMAFIKTDKETKLPQRCWEGEIYAKKELKIEFGLSSALTEKSLAPRKIHRVARRMVC